MTDTHIDNVVKSLEMHGVVIEKGPLSHIGTTGTISSVFVRDPDQNLIEICSKD